MKGAAIATLLIAAFLACCNTVSAIPPLVPPVQYEQFCENQKVSGTGVVDVSTSIVDKKIALEYYNTMAGDGDIELNQEHAYSQDADKLQRNISSVNGGNKAALNLFENTKLTYSGSTPLSGAKYLNSKAFYGGMGADIQEMFSVTQMEKDQTTFFTSTTPYNPKKPCDSVAPYCPYYPDYYPDSYSTTTTPENLIKDLKNAGRDQDKVAELMGNNPAHLIGIETKNTFNGTWGTDARWHKIFYKDVKAHEMFSGQFEADKTIKFHENPVPEKEHPPCEGIDC
ncbi:MAG: hypothetical protein ACE14P_13140 [Methanotrichaceae archaeon]